MMPERDRLASSLFQVDTLRSPIGLAVLHDLIALYQRRSEVLYKLLRRQPLGPRDLTLAFGRTQFFL
jgi:hypothetical protein